MYCSTHNAKEDGSDRHKNRMKKSWHCKATLLLIRRYTQINSYSNNRIGAINVFVKVIISYILGDLVI